MELKISHIKFIVEKRGDKSFLKRSIENLLDNVEIEVDKNKRNWHSLNQYVLCQRDINYTILYPRKGCHLESIYISPDKKLPPNLRGIAYYAFDRSIVCFSLNGNNYSICNRRREDLVNEYKSKNLDTF